MTKFQKQLEEFLQMFGGMEPDNFLEAVPDCQDAIEALATAYKEMKEQSGNIVLPIEGGAALEPGFPEGFVTGIEIRDYDTDGEFGVIKENEFGDKYQQMIFEMKGE